MSPSREPRLHRWDEIPEERLTDTIRRRFVTGERAMLAHLYLDEGAVVPMHSHENEQLTYIVKGALRFSFGKEGADRGEGSDAGDGPDTGDGSDTEDGSGAGDGPDDVIVRAGEVLHIPPNLPHRAEALEDTLDVDVFSPPRRDWIEGTDSYFRDEDGGADGGGDGDDGGEV